MIQLPSPTERFDQHARRRNSRPQHDVPRIARARARRYRLHHLERVRAYDRKRIEDANRITYQRRYHGLRRGLLFDRLGPKCAKCGVADIRVLQFDHVNGGGTRDIRSHGDQTKMYERYLMMPDDELYRHLQVLCANCNLIKKIERKEHRGRVHRSEPNL